MSLVGASNFASIYQNKKEELFGIDDFQQEWIQWFSEFLKISRLSNGITTKFMGTTSSFRKNLISNFNQTERQKYFKDRQEIADIGYFPANVKKVIPSKTLYVNAWDPWSLAGNGNECDNSLDGFMGRNTAIAVLTSPITNSYLANKSAYRDG